MSDLADLEPLQIALNLMKHPDLEPDDLQLTLARAVRLGRGEQPDECEDCAGSGGHAAPGHEFDLAATPVECETCAGSGWRFD
jgi:hypothetical protein